MPATHVAVRIYSARIPPFSANVVEDGIEIGLISAHLHEGIENADFCQFLRPVIDDFGVRRRKCPAGVPGAAISPLNRAPPVRGDGRRRP